MWFVTGVVDALRASGIIKVRRQSSGVVAPTVLQVSMEYRGMCPLFVYYRVSVLFNKWNVSDRAVMIV